jgi:hypothetical protein
VAAVSLLAVVLGIKVDPDEALIHLRRVGPNGEPLNALSRLATITFDHGRHLVDDLQKLMLTHDTRVGKSGITK